MGYTVIDIGQIEGTGPGGARRGSYDPRCLGCS